ncbi:MAG: UMP kinase [Ignavibacteriae bacterium]|nr:MAG: UMP kinase [Ignavibacteriota bacterium]
MKPKFKRVLLKLSGESLSGENDFGIDANILEYLSTEIKKVHDLGIEIGIVIGGGNIYRGLAAQAQGIDSVTGDYMGMLSTIINALALQNSLEKKGIYTRLLSAIEMYKIAEPFIKRRAVRHLEKKRIVIFGAGTGNPYFTTDTAASLRALEINADVILKGTRVNGVYDKDPEKNDGAKMYSKISFSEAYSKNLKIMDMTAFALCQENKIPIIVFNMNVKDNFKKIILGQKVGTLVS